MPEGTKRRGQDTLQVYVNQVSDGNFEFLTPAHIEKNIFQCTDKHTDHETEYHSLLYTHTHTPTPNYNKKCLRFIIKAIPYVDHLYTQTNHDNVVNNSMA